MKFGLLGHPVAHSLSPAIHRAAYQVLGEVHEYVLIDAPSEPDVARALERLRQGDLHGLNVTVPWKRQAFAGAQRRSALAERLQVANVLSREAGQLVAHNTDALALQSEFERLAPGTRAIVIGSGGAAPAVVAACQAAGLSEIWVTARRFVKASAPADWPGSAELVSLGARLLAWPVIGQERDEFVALLAGTSLLVQCTSAGMHGADPGEPLAALVPWSALPQDALVYDLIYAPLETPFLRAAREAGLRTQHGLNMLVGQAALSVELWLGRKPPLAPLLQAAEQALVARRGA